MFFDGPWRARVERYARGLRRVSRFCTSHRCEAYLVPDKMGEDLAMDLFLAMKAVYSSADRKFSIAKTPEP